MAKTPSSGYFMIGSKSFIEAAFDTKISHIYALTSVQQLRPFRVCVESCHICDVDVSVTGDIGVGGGFF